MLWNKCNEFLLLELGFSGVAKTAPVARVALIHIPVWSFWRIKCWIVVLKRTKNSAILTGVNAKNIFLGDFTPSRRSYESLTGK